MLLELSEKYGLETDRKWPCKLVHRNGDFCVIRVRYPEQTWYELSVLVHWDEDPRRNPRTKRPWPYTAHPLVTIRVRKNNWREIAAEFKTACDAQAEAHSTLETLKERSGRQPHRW